VVSFELNFYSGCGLKSVLDIKWRSRYPLAEYVPADAGNLATVFSTSGVAPHVMHVKIERSA
jgi:hypothetical protein